MELAISHSPIFKDLKSIYTLDKYEKASLRCKNFPKISFSDLVEKVKNNEIKELFFLGYSSTFLVITTKGKKHIIQKGDYTTEEIWELLEKVPLMYNEKLKKDKYKNVDIFDYYGSMICK